jgi:alkylation response protein AidB-like acyl-CoA dehydrogenase
VLVSNAGILRDRMLVNMTEDEPREAVQFGRPIGSFQAVKHKCADMLVALEGARADRADRLGL